MFSDQKHHFELWNCYVKTTLHQYLQSTYLNVKTSFKNEHKPTSRVLSLIKYNQTSIKKSDDLLLKVKQSNNIYKKKILSSDKSTISKLQNIHQVAPRAPLFCLG